MDIAEFVAPEFLENTDVDSIHKRMLDMLPDDIDKTEAGFVWDFTRPTAVIASELLEFYVPEIIKLMFPQWSYGQWLDYLGAMAQVTRKPPNYATAAVEITGNPGTVIPAGTVLATASAGGNPSIEFETMEVCSLNADGNGTVIVQALLAGTDSNVNPGTITLMSIPIDGVTNVTNPEAATGGAEEETDDDYRERILERNAEMDTSFVGNNADYKRWAEEVTGIGTAIVIPEWNGPETVKIVCLDANGVAANQTLLNAVYEHIMQPNDPMERLAPPNVILTVAQPTLVEITYTFTATLRPDFELETIVEDFGRALDDYYKTASKEGTVKYNQVHALLTNTAGVSDFQGLLMNGGTVNINIAQDQYPHTNGIDGGE